MYDFVLHLPVRVLQVSSGSFSRFFLQRSNNLRGTRHGATPDKREYWL